MQTSSLKALLAWSGCVVLIAGGIYACSSTTVTDSGGGKDGSAQGDDGATGGGDDDGSTGGDDGGGGGIDSGGIIKKDGGGDSGLSAADLACIQSPDAQACDPCCSAAHNNGGDKFTEFQISCACETARCGGATKKSPPYGGCGTSNICKDGGTTPSATCGKCLNYEFSEADGSAGDAGCLPQVFGQCEQNADCLGYLQCAVNCP